MFVITTWERKRRNETWLDFSGNWVADNVCLSYRKGGYKGALVAAGLDNRGRKSIIPFRQPVRRPHPFTPCPASHLMSTSVRHLQDDLQQAGTHKQTRFIGHTGMQTHSLMQAGGRHLVKALAGLECCMSCLRWETHVQVTVTLTALCYRSKPRSPYYTPVVALLFSPYPSTIPLPPPPLPLCTCVCMHKLNMFKGWGEGHQIREEDLAGALLPLASLLRSSPKSYFMVPSIRSLGSPQLPSPDAGLSPSLGTRTGLQREGMWHTSAPPETASTPIILAQRRGRRLLTLHQVSHTAGAAGAASSNPPREARGHAHKPRCWLTQLTCSPAKSIKQ